jgi:hypothetical protein
MTMPKFFTLITRSLVLIADLLFLYRQKVCAFYAPLGNKGGLADSHILVGRL